MANSARGTKRHCQSQSCGGKFYDLNKVPITCPFCDTVFDPEVLLKSRRVKPLTPAAAPKAEAVVGQEPIEAAIGAVDDDIDAEVLEDNDGLAIVGSGSGDGEDESATAAMPIEDDLDAVDVVEDEE